MFKHYNIPLPTGAWTLYVTLKHALWVCMFKLEALKSLGRAHLGLCANQIKDTEGFITKNVFWCW